MSGVGSINLKVAVVDSDRYALNAIRAYCAWDRRTRVVQRQESLDALKASWAGMSPRELPDVLILDANHLGGAALLETAIIEVRQVRCWSDGHLPGAIRRSGFDPRGGGSGRESLSAQAGCADSYRLGDLPG